MRYFRALEEENGFMLHGDDGYFQQMLSQIRSEINTGGIATVPVNDVRTDTLHPTPTMIAHHFAVLFAHHRLHVVLPSRLQRSTELFQCLF